MSKLDMFNPVLPTVFGEQLSYYEALCKLRHELGELKKKVDEFDGGEVVEELKREVESIREEITRLQGEDQTISELVDAVQDDVTNILSEIESLKESVQNIRDEDIAGIEDEISGLQQEIQNVRDEVIGALGGDY